MDTPADSFAILTDQAMLDLWARPRVRTDRPVLVPVKTALETAPDGSACLYHTHDNDWRPVERPQWAPLAEFIKLHDLPRRPERARTFAERYGLLKTCGHERPDNHKTRNYGGFPWCRAWDCEECNQRQHRHWDGHADVDSDGASCMCLVCWDTGLCSSCDDAEFREPLTIWAATAAHFRAGLRIAACVRLGQPLLPGDLQTLQWGSRWGPPSVGETIVQQSRDSARFAGMLVPQIVGEWLNDRRPSIMEGFHMHFSLGDAFIPDGIHLQPMGLLANLSIQFAGALASTRGLYICDECGDPFQPTQRAPWKKGGRRALCSGCRRSPERKARVQRERYATLHPTQQRSSRHRKGPTENIERAGRGAKVVQNDPDDGD